MIILLAILLALVIISYTPEDISWNAASSEEIHNLLGSWGSYTADIIWQYLGIAGILLSVVLGAWGWRIGTQRGLDLFWGRTFAALLSVLAAGIAIAALDPTAALGYTRFWGGAFGNIIAENILHWLSHRWGGYILAVPMFILSFGTLYMASALTFGEWQDFGRLLNELAHAVTTRIIESIEEVWHSLRNRYENRDEEIDTDLEEETEEEDDEETEEDEVEEEEGDETEENQPPVKRIFGNKKKTPLVQRPTTTSRQARLPLRSDEAHELPPIDLLQWPESSRKSPPELSEESLERNAKLLESVLADFGVYGQITKVSPGPVVTLYELEPSPGTRSSRVISLADDIARNMSAVSVRVAVVQGRNVIGIELPNKKREMVFLRELLCTDAYTEHKGGLPLILGKDISGAPIITDLSRMPHLLIAGTTGSGKSVAINTMILSLLYRLPPEKCRFIMIDPKMLELSVYEGIPHLLAPVVTEPKKAIVALKWTVREMEERYRAMSKLGVRNIEGYNIRLREAAKTGENLMRTVQTGFDRETGKPVYEEQPLDLTALPYIVVIVDEMADLMLVAGKEIESAVQRLAQMARAAGIHILMATQRPSVDVITGTIKANFPTRVSFQVTSKIDSRTILGEQGAEQLLGLGDMLYMAGGGRITRVHGPFVRDEEVEEIVKFLKAQGEPEYLDEITEEEGEGMSSDFTSSGGSESNDLYDKAVDIVLRERKASISFVQRHLSIGYNRAATIIERMEKDGIISEANHVGKREIYGRKPGDD
ncbi:MAG: DNA translocase FtsK 4TM domain-containing protein [Alphaproteobacteria bacterium]|nr:DNA translocase FtsK 4TM domain-containing protein [Alphaproteobacteria bacterium]